MQRVEIYIDLTSGQKEILQPKFEWMNEWLSNSFAKQTAHFVYNKHDIYL